MLIKRELIKRDDRIRLELSQLTSVDELQEASLKNDAALLAWSIEVEELGRRIYYEMCRLNRGRATVKMVKDINRVLRRLDILNLLELGIPVRDARQPRIKLRGAARGSRGLSYEDILNTYNFRGIWESYVDEVLMHRREVFRKEFVRVINSLD